MVEDGGSVIEDGDSLVAQISIVFIRSSIGRPRSSTR